MTVTRCAVRLADGQVGYGYVSGRNERQAEIAAVLDAMLLDGRQRDVIDRDFLEPLRKAREEKRRQRSRKAAATTVEFFTMVRGDD